MRTSTCTAPQPCEMQHTHAPRQASRDATANARREQLDQLSLRHVEQLLQLDTAVYELSERSALLGTSTLATRKGREGEAHDANVSGPFFVMEPREGPCCACKPVIDGLQAPATAPPSLDVCWKGNHCSGMWHGRVLAPLQHTTPTVPPPLDEAAPPCRVVAPRCCAATGPTAGTISTALLTTDASATAWPRWVDERCRGGSGGTTGRPRTSILLLDETP